MIRNKITEQQRRQIVELYGSGASCLRIGRLLSVSKSAAWSALKAAGIAMRPQRGSREFPGRVLSKYTLNEDAFDVLSPEAMYWLGFLLADGSVSSRKHTIQLKLSAKDRSHVEAFARFLETDKAVIDGECESGFEAKGPSRYSSLVVTSKKMP